MLKVITSQLNIRLNHKHTYNNYLINRWLKDVSQTIGPVLRTKSLNSVVAATTLFLEELKSVNANSAGTALKLTICIGNHYFGSGITLKPIICEQSLSMCHQMQNSTGGKHLIKILLIFALNYVF